MGILLSLAVSSLACQTAEPDRTEPPSLYDTQKQIVQASLDDGKPEAASRLLKDMLRQHPDDPELLNLMGLTQLVLHNPQRAIKSLTQAYKATKKIGFGVNLSSALMESGDLDKAERLLLALNEVGESKNYEHQERILHNLGYVAFKKKNFAKAETWFKRAIEETPSFYPSHVELARVYERTGRIPMATQQYRRAIDYCLPCYEPVYALTRLYTQQKRTGDATRLLMQFSRVETAPLGDKKKAADLLRAITIGHGNTAAAFDVARPDAPIRR